MKKVILSIVLIAAIIGAIRSVGYGSTALVLFIGAISGVITLLIIFIAMWLFCLLVFIFFDGRGALPYFNPINFIKLMFDEYVEKE